MAQPRAALVLGLAVILAGCRATPPGKWETAAMTKLKHSITIRGKDAKNPACHGFDGQNTGVPFADRMAPPVPLLNSSQVQSYTDGQLHWILENGVSPSGMPGSKGILTDRELWSIVLYARHLPPAGSLGEPPMYSGDNSAEKCPTPAAQAR
jgi:Cytochrome C oxidase, cbb3-type, subunit III